MSDKTPKALVWRLIGAITPPLEMPLRRRLSKSCDDNWRYRSRVVEASADNDHIPRVPNAGHVEGDVQIMHNGLKVVCGSYYGKGPTLLLRRNKGVHEPQEERMFQEVLKVIPSGGVIVELGAYWAFYSMWFCKNIQRASAFMVEPALENLEFGKRNFAINGFEGHFTHGFVGSAAGVLSNGARVISVDEFVSEHKIDRIDILHCDIQGYEIEMLRGAKRVMAEGRVSWFFISTHSEELHAECERMLVNSGFIVAASVSPTQSFSVDGVLVARSAAAPQIQPVNLSRRQA